MDRESERRRRRRKSLTKRQTARRREGEGDPIGRRDKADKARAGIDPQHCSRTMVGNSAAGGVTKVKQRGAIDVRAMEDAIRMVFDENNVSTGRTIDTT